MTKVHLGPNPACGNEGAAKQTTIPSEVTCTACARTLRMAIRELEMHYAPRDVPRHELDRLRKKSVAKWRQERSNR